MSNQNKQPAATTTPAGQQQPTTLGANTFAPAQVGGNYLPVQSGIIGGAYPAGLVGGTQFIGGAQLYNSGYQAPLIQTSPVFGGYSGYNAAPALTGYTGYTGLAAAPAYTGYAAAPAYTGYSASAFAGYTAPAIATAPVLATATAPALATAPAPLTQSYIEYVPYTQNYVETVPVESTQYVPVEKVYVEQVAVPQLNYVPVQKTFTDYYAVEHQIEHVPQTRYQTFVENVPVQAVHQTVEMVAVPRYETHTEYVPQQRVQEFVEYVPVERSFIHAPAQTQPVVAGGFVGNGLAYSGVGVPAYTNVLPAANILPATNVLPATSFVGATTPYTTGPLLGGAPAFVGGAPLYNHSFGNLVNQQQPQQGNTTAGYNTLNQGGNANNQPKAL